MATWLVVLIIVLSVIVGVPLYALIGAKVAKYVIAILCGCNDWLMDGSPFRSGYNEVVNNYPWRVALLFPLVLFMAMVALVVCSVCALIRWIKYIF